MKSKKQKKSIVMVFFMGVFFYTAGYATTETNAELSTDTDANAMEIDITPMLLAPPFLESMPYGEHAYIIKRNDDGS